MARIGVHHDKNPRPSSRDFLSTFARLSILAALEKLPGARKVFARGYRPPFSELYLRNDHGLSVHFRVGTNCPEPVRKKAGELFESERDGMLDPERFGEIERFIKFVAQSGHDSPATNLGHDDALDFIAGRKDAEHRAARLRADPRKAA